MISTISKFFVFPEKTYRFFYDEIKRRVYFFVAGVSEPRSPVGSGVNNTFISGGTDEGQFLLTDEMFVS